MRRGFGAIVLALAVTATAGTVLAQAKPEEKPKKKPRGK